MMTVGLRRRSFHHLSTHPAPPRHSTPPLNIGCRVQEAKLAVDLGQSIGKLVTTLRALLISTSPSIDVAESSMDPRSHAPFTPAEQTTLSHTDNYFVSVGSGSIEIDGRVDCKCNFQSVKMWRSSLNHDAASTGTDASTRTHPGTNHLNARGRLMTAISVQCIDCSLEFNYAKILFMRANSATPTDPPTSPSSPLSSPPPPGITIRLCQAADGATEVDISGELISVVLSKSTAASMHELTEKLTGMVRSALLWQTQLFKRSLPSNFLSFSNIALSTSYSTLMSNSATTRPNPPTHLRDSILKLVSVMHSSMSFLCRYSDVSVFFFDHCSTSQDCILLSLKAAALDLHAIRSSTEITIALAGHTRFFCNFVFCI